MCSMAPISITIIEVRTWSAWNPRSWYSSAPDHPCQTFVSSNAARVRLAPVASIIPAGRKAGQSVATETVASQGIQDSLLLFQNDELNPCALQSMAHKEADRARAHNDNAKVGAAHDAGNRWNGVMIDLIYVFRQVTHAAIGSLVSLCFCLQSIPSGNSGDSLYSPPCSDITEDLKVQHRSWGIKILVLELWLHWTCRKHILLSCVTLSGYCIILRPPTTFVHCTALCLILQASRRLIV